jgi:hypothetical protein
MSGPGFDTIIRAIDGILIWVLKPSKVEECRTLKCGEKSFFCARKDKFGVNMQAICDKNKLCFTWIDITWPGCTASPCFLTVTSPFQNQILYFQKESGTRCVRCKGYIEHISVYSPFILKIVLVPKNKQFNIQPVSMNK